MASIGHCFEPPEERDDAEEWGFEEQTRLEPMSPQSDRADEFLDLFETVVLQPDYEARLERHYQMMKDADTSEFEATKPDKSRRSNAQTPRVHASRQPDAAPQGDGPVTLDDDEVRKAKQKRMRRGRRLMTRSVKRRRKKAQKLARYPLAGAYIGEGWREDSFANIMVTRDAPRGNQAFLGLLIDLGCLGLKDWVFKPNETKERIRRIKEKSFQDQVVTDISLDLAARILEHAVTWQEKAGLDVNPGYFVADAYLGDAAPFASDEPIPLGRDGKHFYMPGPRDDWKPVLDKLRGNLGEDGFHYFVPAGEFPFG